MWRLLFLMFTLVSDGLTRISRRSNIVLILTDDQDTELGSLSFMPKTKRFLRDEGAEFVNAFVTTAMCCPSRSSILTGMYSHNHDVYTNNDNCSSLQWQQQHESRTFGAYLHNADYRTGYFGKYLNQYLGTHIPFGWTEWVGLIRNSRFYNYTLNFNGRKVKHGDIYHLDYLTDLIVNDSVTFLKQSKQYFPDKPVAMVLGMPAPHGPEDSAPQFQQLFPNETTHHTPSWNYAPNPDKQWLLQEMSKMEPIHQIFTDVLQRKRLQTLQSVDDAVEKVVNELAALGELDNTYILYTSDHGYHLGQYGLVKGKAMPYDFDIRVPFIIRGPGIPKGVRVADIALNVDIAPTLLDMAGVPTPEHMDGNSVLGLFRDDGYYQLGDTLPRKSFWRDTVLIERGKVTEKKLKDRDHLEAFQNQHHLTSKAARLERECQKGEYQPPCQGNQQWACEQRSDGSYRMVKCRYGWQGERKKSGRCVCPGDPEFDTYNLELQNRRQKRDVTNSSVDCQYLPDGTVSCNKHIYQTLDAWKQEQKDVSESIQGLRQKLHQLKGIKKHLRNRKPEDADDAKEQEGSASYADDSEAEIDGWDYEDLSMERIDTGPSQNEELTTGDYESEMPSDDMTALPDECICDSDLGTVRHSRQKRLDRLDRQDRKIQRRIEKRERRRQKKKDRKNGKGAMKNCGDPSTCFDQDKDASESKRNDATCSRDGMECVRMDNDHWQTQPRWTLGPFCFCPNANNNTYWCLRTVNDTHNFLYCEFITGFISFYNITKDPYELKNAVLELTNDQLQFLHHTLAKMKSCSGHEQCTIHSATINFDSRRSSRRRMGQQEQENTDEVDRNTRRRKWRNVWRS